MFSNVSLKDIPLDLLLNHIGVLKIPLFFLKKKKKILGFKYCSKFNKICRNTHD